MSGWDVHEIMERIRPSVEEILTLHQKIETAPRRTCPICQFESTDYWVSHNSDCPRYEPYSMGRLLG